MNPLAFALVFDPYRVLNHAVVTHGCSQAYTEIAGLSEVRMGFQMYMDTEVGWHCRMAVEPNVVRCICKD